MSGASAARRPLTVPAERSAGAVLRSLLLAAATVVLLLAVSLLPLLTPPFIHAALSASGGAAAGATLEQSQALSDRTVAELLFGPGTFAIAGPDGAPLYGADEAAHLRDVRLVLYAFLGLAFVAALVLGAAIARRRADPTLWRAIAWGGAALVVGLAAAGVFAALAFGVAFELFHRLLFPGGNWAFDPAHSNLVRLYPLGFWQLSAAAYGGLAIAAGTAAWWFGRRRARTQERSR